MTLLAIDHVQLAMPAGDEDKARTFYRDILGLDEVTKPPALAVRGGCWFGGNVQIHLGVEADFRPAKKAHPAFTVDGLDDFANKLAESGFSVTWDENIPGLRRFYTADPFGNRIEFSE